MGRFWWQRTAAVAARAVPEVHREEGVVGVEGGWEGRRAPMEAAWGGEVASAAAKRRWRAAHALACSVFALQTVMQRLRTEAWWAVMPWSWCDEETQVHPNAPRPWGGLVLSLERHSFYLVRATHRRLYLSNNCFLCPPVSLLLVHPSEDARRIISTDPDAPDLLPPPVTEVREQETSPLTPSTTAERLPRRAPRMGPRGRREGTRLPVRRAAAQPRRLVPHRSAHGAGTVLPVKNGC